MEKTSPVKNDIVYLVHICPSVVLCEGVYLTAWVCEEGVYLTAWVASVGLCWLSNYSWIASETSLGLSPP